MNKIKLTFNTNIKKKMYNCPILIDTFNISIQLHFDVSSVNYLFTIIIAFTAKWPC